MKIAFVNDHLSQGGVATTNRKLMAALLDLGHSVENITIFGDQSVDGAVNVSFRMPRYAALLIFPLIWKLFWQIQKGNFDYIISCKDYINIWVILAFRLQRRRNSILLVNSHSPISHKLRQHKNMVQFLSIHVARFLYPYADVVANVSKGASQDSKDFFRLDKVVTLYNAVISPNDFHIDPPVPNHPYFDQQGAVVVACGRLEREKDYELMINAFAHALQKRNDLFLIILGEGSARNELEQQIARLCLSDRISLPGFQEQPIPYMAHCKVFWLTSQFESFGVVLVEALSVGANIVSRDCPYGPREILCDGRYGRLVSSDDPIVHATELAAAVDSPKVDRSALQSRAMDFEAIVCANRYLDEYQRNSTEHP